MSNTGPESAGRSAGSGVGGAGFPRGGAGAGQKLAGRLPPEIFDLPVEKIREGYYTDEYFNRTRQVLLEDDRHPRVVMQVFQKKDAVLAGIDEAIAVLKLCADDWEGLTVHALYEGDEIAPWETVM